MKLKKLLLTTLVSASMFSVGCTVNGNVGTSSEISEHTIYGANDQTDQLNNSLFTVEGCKRLDAEPSDQSTVDSFIDMIISKGTEAITGGLQVYGKYIVLNLLKECGIDLRDATTKTLEKVQQQLNVIENKIDAIAAKQEKYQSELILNPVLQMFVSARSKYSTYVAGTLGYLAGLENDGTMSEEDIEKERQAAYDNGISALIVDGAPFATYVTDLANKILVPNTAAQGKDIFYYYDRTNGSCDKWTIQYYKNIKNFIAYIDSTLVTFANLAKYQLYYKSLNVDEGTRRAYSMMIDTMAEAVNAVNNKFAVKLEELSYIKIEWENYGINKYVPTNKYYSTRMATLTYSLDDYVYADSRQGLLVGYKNKNTGTHGMLQVAFSYQPNQDIIQAVTNDYKEFAGDYCTSSYTIQDYLESAGFYANNMDLYKKSLGLYNGDLYVDCHGFYHNDVDYSLSYYDSYGNYQRRNAFEIVSYHTWYGGVDRTELRANDKNYYLCFGTTNLSTRYTTLDGRYQQTYMHDCMFTVAEKVYFQYPYTDLYQKVGPIGYHECW